MTSRRDRTVGMAGAGAAAAFAIVRRGRTR
jgi:hypothetical protein